MVAGATPYLGVGVVPCLCIICKYLLVPMCLLCHSSEDLLLPLGRMMLTLCELSMLSRHLAHSVLKQLVIRSSALSDASLFCLASGSQPCKHAQVRDHSVCRVVMPYMASVGLSPALSPCLKVERLKVRMVGF